MTKMPQGICPHCNSENLEYGVVNLEGDQCYFPRTCEDCGAIGEEWYSMEFIGHYNMLDKNGNEIHLLKKKQILQSPRYYFKDTLSKTLERKTENERSFKIDLELKIDDGKIVFTACGRYFGGGGQCLDFMNDYLKGDEVWDRVYRLWKAHHLNNMHAGTERQEEFIEMGIKSGELKSHNYDEVKEFLIKWGMYEDDGYKYGSQWLYRPIPTEDLWEIFTLLK